MCQCWGCKTTQYVLGITKAQDGWSYHKASKVLDSRGRRHSGLSLSIKSIWLILQKFMKLGKRSSKRIQEGAATEAEGKPGECPGGF